MMAAGTYPIRHLPLRLSAFSFTIFAALGIFLPYWPLWLKDRGCSPKEIGTILGANILVRAIGSPLAAQLVDTTDKRKLAVIWLAALSVPVFALFWICDSFLALLAVCAAFGILQPPLMPLSDNLTMLASVRHGLHYGRMRLWGSIGFLTAATLGGSWFTGRDPDVIFFTLLIVLAISALTAFALPDIRVHHGERKDNEQSPLRSLLTCPRFLLLLATVGLIQASHASYYSFASLHWEAQGIGKGIIGVLWAEGVVAEIVLFFFATGFIARLGPYRLFTIGASVAVLRWYLTASATSVPALAAVQWLHAMSFGATHLAAIQFVQREVEDSCSATAQSLTAAVSMGLFMAPATILAGELFAVSGADAFYAMSGVAALGGICGILLARMPAKL